MPVAVPRYATFARRVRALVLDALVLSVAFVVVAFLAGSFHLPEAARLGLFTAVILTVVLYEAVTVSVWGRTIGHRLANLRVVAPTATGRLPLWMAFLRWLLKVVTGLASFATMGATRRNQALHDLPFRTTVEIADPARAKEHEYVLERPAPDVRRLPSPGRRLAVMLAYLVLLMVVSWALMSAAVSGACLQGNACSREDARLLQLFDTVWLAASISAAAFGWRGRLPGARGVAPSAIEAPAANGPAAPAAMTAGARRMELYLFCGLCAFFAICYGALALQPGEGMDKLVAWGPSFAVAWWLAADSRRTRVIGAYDAGLFFYLTWPLSLPWYARRSRGPAWWSLALELYGLALVGPLGYVWGATLRYLALSP
jgi:hypothetical protein